MGTRHLRDGLWKRKGRPAVIPENFDDGFVIGTTMPTTANTGVYASLPRLTYDGPALIDGSTDPLAPLVIDSRNVDRLLTVRSGYVRFVNCLFTGGPGTFDTGQVDCRAAGVGRVWFERCTFTPAQRSFYLNALIGHHMTVRRCYAAGVVDFVGSYNTHAPATDNVIEGNYLSWLVRYETDHVHTDGTHNDGIQHQGGSGLVVRGNFLWGRMFYEDGATVPTGDYGTRPAQGVLVQQNVQTGTACNPVIENNWVRGWQHPIVVKTRSSGGTAYNATITNNVWLDDDQRYYGTTEEYGLPGRPYNIRCDAAVTVNGISYPLGSATQDTNGNAYAVVPEVHANRRGQPVYVRRDTFTG